MNEQFVTEALRNDRCLKAARLIKRLEKELGSEIERVGGRIVNEHPDLFKETAEVSCRASFDSSTIFGNARDNIDLYRVNPDKPSKTQTLNLSVRWVDPLDWGEDEVEGALCAACYKINNGNVADFKRVEQKTRNGDWTIGIGDDQFNNAPGLFYIPVENARDITAGLERLEAHFAEFGDSWGVLPSEITGGEE